MDNMRARMRMPEREAAKAGVVSKQEEHSRYVSPRPVAEPKRKKNSSVLKWLLPILVLALVLGLAFGAWKMFFSSTGADGIDRGKYQAVFLSNGTITNNVYFGKLERMNDGYYKLSDAFYVKAAETTEEDKPSSDITLTKLGSEIYGPQDTLIIPREQVLYYQNMKDDSKITEAIKKYTNEKK